MDDLSRITNATRDVATTLHHFTRAEERLVRAVAAARQAGVSQHAIEGAIGMAARGRPDIAETLTAYGAPAASHPQPDPAVADG